MSRSSNNLNICGIRKHSVKALKNDKYIYWTSSKPTVSLKSCPEVPPILEAKFINSASSRALMLLHSHQRNTLLASSGLFNRGHAFILKIIKLVLEAKTRMEDNECKDSDSDHTILHVSSLQNTCLRRL